MFIPNRHLCQHDDVAIVIHVHLSSNAKAEPKPFRYVINRKNASPTVNRTGTMTQTSTRHLTWGQLTELIYGSVDKASLIINMPHYSDASS